MATMVRDISKRLLIESALMDYGRFLHVSDADIDELYQKIEKLNEDCFNDEKSFEIVDKYNLDTITSREDLKKRIENMRGQLAEKIFDYYTADDKTDISRFGEDISAVLKNIGVRENVAKKLAQSICERKLKDELSSDELDNFNRSVSKNTKRKKTTDAKEQVRWADLLAQSIYDKQKTLKEKLSLDLQTYQDMRAPNPVIDAMLPNIKANLYGLKVVLYYSTPKETKYFRERLRKDFARDGGSRRTILQINGLMAENGKNFIKNGSTVSNYDDFEALIKKHYGQDNYLQIVDTALNIQRGGKDEETLKQERRQTYDDKSRLLYCQLMASLLSEKRKYDIENVNPGIDYAMYVETLEHKYIRALCSGQNNIGALGMTDAGYTATSANASEERRIRKQIMDDTAENQVVSVNHHLPLGAADDVVTRFFGYMDDEKKFVKACELVNVVGNNCVVVGKDKHQSMEAKGAYDVKQNQEGTIFAGRVDWRLLGALQDKLPKYLWGAFEDNLKTNSAIQDVAIVMRFPESKYMIEERRKLQSENASLSQVLTRVME